MSSHEVICCGGPADGTWRVVEGREFRVLVPALVNPRDEDLAGDPEYPLQEVIYRVTPVPILGRELWVAVAIAEAYDDQAVIRAIFQRDVAKHLGAYR